MLKFHVVIVFSWFLCGLAMAAETKKKEKVYYKHTLSTVATDTSDGASKDIPIVVEGEPPFTKSTKLNSAKLNSISVPISKKGKTVPRKGVLNESTEKIDHNITVPLGTPLEKPVVEKTSNESNKQIFGNLTKISTTEKSTTLHVAPVSEVTPKQMIINDTVSSTTARKPKPKPDITIGGKEADGPIPASPTNKSPLGMPRKIDYIVPIVITVTALPLLSIAFYVLYKRGRDYWDKRHYRRMDFLIDGMYNE